MTWTSSWRSTPGALPAAIETAAMTRLCQESHARMLGNGMCTRPVELDCRMETICEPCAYFETGPQFVPVLLRQRHHARIHHQTNRASSTTPSSPKPTGPTLDTDPAYKRRV
jgi:hypothetical protein